MLLFYEVRKDKKLPKCFAYTESKLKKKKVFTTSIMEVGWIGWPNRLKRSVLAPCNICFLKATNFIEVQKYPFCINGVNHDKFVMSGQIHFSMAPFAFCFQHLDLKEGPV